MKNIVLLGHGIGVKIVIESLISSNIGYRVAAIITHPFEDHSSDFEMIAKRKEMYGDFSYNVFDSQNDFNIPVFESSNVNDSETVELIEKYYPSFIISIGCRNIIKKEFLQRFPKKVLNMHTTPLPSYRGAANDTWMILNGEWGKDKYGCIHFVDEGIDTGDIIAKQFYNIPYFSYPIDVFKTRMAIFRTLLIEGLKKLEYEDFIPEKQNIDLATVFPRLFTPKDGHIKFRDWHGNDIIKFIYAFGYPFSGAFAFLGEVKISILRAEFLQSQTFHPYANGLIVGKNELNQYKIAVNGGICLIKTIEVNGMESPQNKFMKLGKYFN